MKISIAGLGYVGFSLAILLSQKYEVFAYDIDINKVNSINNKKSFIKEPLLQNFLNKKKLKIIATCNRSFAFKDADFIVIATPTNFNSKTNSFNTKSVESVIEEVVRINKKATIIIRSTVPIGFTESMQIKYNNKKIIFSPEFLRETTSLYDNLYPSRIIVGSKSTEAKKFTNLLVNCCYKKKSQVNQIHMNSSEAEAVKLFSNTYLAMRISFMNELDSFAEANKLSTKKIIEGVCTDQRIGNFYNNPSFGYGGYCLPKDTKQLLRNYKKIPNDLIRSVIKSNKTRKKFITNSIMSKKPKTIGIFRLVMKSNSDNFRDSAIIDIINELKKKKVKILIHEPFLESKRYQNLDVINDINVFIKKSDLIVANRVSNKLKNVKHKLYTRDIYKCD